MGSCIRKDLTRHDEDREDSGISLRRHSEGNDHCSVVGQGSSNDYLGFYRKSPTWTEYDYIILRLEDSHGAKDTQQVRLLWFDRKFSSYVPLVLRNHPE